MSKSTSQSGHRDSHDHSEPHGPFSSKKKEKGYKTVGASSDEDDDIAMLPPSSDHGSKSSKPKPFRLKKHKSFKDRDKPRESEGALQRTKIKHAAGNNPFYERPAGKIQVTTTNAPVKPGTNSNKIFGVSLTNAIKIDRSPDGSEIPAFFRVCINYIEDHGLESVGIYRISGSQSRIQELKQHFDRGDRVRLNDYDVATVADIIKLYIRELPDKLVSDDVTRELDDCAELPDLGKRVDAALKVLEKMPAPERSVLGLLLVHMTHVIERQEVNKMSLKNVAMLLEPTLRIQSSKALNFLLTHTGDLFSNIKLNRTAANSNEQNLALLREELLDKEATLNKFHLDIKQGKASKKKEEKIWDIQRQVTELKRKIRTLEKITNVPTADSSTKKEPDSSQSGVLSPVTPSDLSKAAQDGSAPEKGDKDDRRSQLLEAVDLIAQFQALNTYNLHLREKISKEYDHLQSVCDKITEPEIELEESGDRLELLREVHHLIDQYQSAKKMTTELNDAILSETSEYVRVSTELNRRKLQSQLLSLNA